MTNNVILAIDVGYHSRGATAAGILFHDWPDPEPYEEIKVQVNDIAEYVPGQFFRRELPCVVALLQQLDVFPTVIVVDGFVHLGPERHAGLGQYLYEKLDAKIPVIGVAKNPYKDSTPESAIVRGDSSKPLFVTAVGVDETMAREWITMMHGSYRIPTLLKYVDGLSREIV